jgi:hypothetical protein
MGADSLVTQCRGAVRPLLVCSECRAPIGPADIELIE